MSKIITLNDLSDESFLNDILSQDIIIYEDVQGSKIWVNWSGSDLQIRPKSISNEPINLVDLAMQKYYNKAYIYLSNLDNRVKSLLHNKWWFCFEYFPDNQPANIEYDRIPKNGLILTSINKNGKYTFNVEEIEEYARLIGVDMISIIYRGKLTDTAKESIMYFINTSEEDLEYVFGEKSFSYFFYKILNPNLKNSFLMNSENFQENVEKLVIRTKNGDSSFQLLNPLYQRLNQENKTEFVEIYTLILINFLNFCQSVDLENLKLKGFRRDEVYIYLISNLYNMYMAEVKEDFINFDFTIPDFFNQEKFKINTSLISNKLTRNYIKENPKLEYIFKAILGSFNKKRKRKIGLFTEDTVNLFNNFVDSIKETIDIYLGKMSEMELHRKGLLDFNDYFKISYNTDGEGKVYPDVYREFSKEKSSSKKKNKFYKKDNKF